VAGRVGDALAGLARVVAPPPRERAGDATADEEKGFQGANTILVSSTVSCAALPSTARIANWEAPGRHISIQVSGE
jgi:hypothetical protein